MNKNIIFIFLIIIFFGVGIGFGYLFFNKTCPALECQIDKNDTYGAGWNAARDRLIDLGIIRSMDKNLEIIEISGTVKKVESNKVIVKIIPLEPLANPELDERIARIDKDTEIVKKAEKDTVQFKKEIEEYNILIRGSEFDINSSDYPLPPNRYEEVNIGLDEVIFGSGINVKAGEDIRDKKEFIARKIIIQPK